jgi:hypothetical protein
VYGKTLTIGSVKERAGSSAHQFISAELNLVLTVSISKSTDDEERSKRNLNHARKPLK